MNLIEYRLTCLAEECAEVIQAVSKVKRFGLHRMWGGRSDSNRTNREGLITEMKDVLTVMRVLSTHNEFAELTGLVGIGLDDDMTNNRERMKAHERLARELGQLGSYSYAELSSKTQQLLEELRAAKALPRESVGKHGAGPLHAPPVPLDETCGFDVLATRISEDDYASPFQYSRSVSSLKAATTAEYSDFPVSVNERWETVTAWGPGAVIVSVKIGREELMEGRSRQVKVGLQVHPSDKISVTLGKV